MKCSNCGSFIDDGSKFCGNCGAVCNCAPTVRCPHCNVELNADDAFCYACGKPVKQTPVYAPYPAPRGSATKLVIIILSIILGVVLVAVAGIYGYNKYREAQYDRLIFEESLATPAPTSIPAPSFMYATASSIRGTDTEGGTYSVLSVLSPDPMTKWVPAKSSDSGIYEWVQIYSNSEQYVRGVNILNGYHKNATTWGYNNRVRYCTLTFSDGTTRDFTLPDTMDLITLDFGGIVKTSSIKLTITGVYRGSKWNDTAITYLGAY